MAKVTINEMPTASPDVFYITDKKGRKIGLREPEFSAEFDIIHAVGTSKSSDANYMKMVNPLTYVAEIDGIPVKQPRDEAEVNRLINTVGRHAFMPIIEAITKHFGDADEFQEKLKNE